MSKAFRIWKLLIAVVIVTGPIIACQGRGIATANTETPTQIAASVPFQIENEWYWPGGGDHQGVPAYITVKSVDPEGTVQGKITLDNRGIKVGNGQLTRTFGENQNPPISAHWDGQTLVVQWLTLSKTRYELNRNGAWLTGKVSSHGEEISPNAAFSVKTHVAEGHFPIEKEWFWLGGGAANGGPTHVIVTSVDPDGTLQGRIIVDSLKGERTPYLTATFGENRSPPVYAHWDGERLVVRFIGSGVRYELDRDGEQLKGKFYMMRNGGPYLTSEATFK